jgi:hypothetical protein
MVIGEPSPGTRQLKKLKLEANLGLVPATDIAARAEEQPDGTLSVFHLSPIRVALTITNDGEHVFWAGEPPSLVLLEDDAGNRYSITQRIEVPPTRSSQYPLTFKLTEQQVRSTKSVRLHLYDLPVAHDLAAVPTARVSTSFTIPVSIREERVEVEPIECVVADEALAKPPEIVARLAGLGSVLLDCMKDVPAQVRAELTLHAVGGGATSLLGFENTPRKAQECLRTALRGLTIGGVPRGKPLGVRCGLRGRGGPAQRCVSDGECGSCGRCVPGAGAKFCMADECAVPTSAEKPAALPKSPEGSRRSGRPTRQTSDTE